MEAMRSSFRARLRCACFLVLLLGGLEVVAQDYEAQFVNGIKAMDRGSWSEAIAYFRAAIAARPREGTGAEVVQIYGMRTRPYLPHYYLGVAYANFSNCDAALEQFAESEQQGAIQKSGEYKTLLRLREKCRGSASRVATRGPVEIAPPPKPIAVVQAPPTAVALPSTRIPFPSPTENGSAAKALPDASTELRPVVPSPLPKDMSTRIKSASSRPGATPPPPIAGAVPLPLLEGASAYFWGDYARAVRTLESIPDFKDRHAVAEARLIRSAARYALFVIGGRKDSEMEQRARRDVSDCRRLDPQVSPNRKVFSPRFVKFFAQVIGEPSHFAN
jgi:hypothetical protein